MRGPSLALALVLLGGTVAHAEIDNARARRYFSEAQSTCERDGGRLWGASLCGPILFVDQETRAIAANRADPQGLLRAQDGVFTGRMPQDQNIANTSVWWSGVEWIEMVWQDLPEDPEARMELMMHEAFHHIQGQLGLKTSNADNKHLDTVEGRTFLQLEWRALSRAISSASDERKRAIEDALVFRILRHRTFPGGASDERKLELNEGMAEYTGVKLSSAAEAVQVKRMLLDLKDAAMRSTFVRSFAYGSGPAYGLLLDGAGGEWRQRVRTEGDLGELLAESYGVKVTDDLVGQATARSKKYDGDALRASEQARKEQRNRIAAENRARFVDGPILTIPLHKMNVQFNPGNLQPLADQGTVYPTMRIVDVWGVLTVAKGALLSSDWKQVTITAPRDPAAQALAGEGWTLELKPGWHIRPAPRAGSFVVGTERE